MRAERLGHKVRDLEEELARQRDRSQKLTKQLDDEKRTRQKAEIELGMARGLPTKVEPDPEMLARVQELEAALSQASAREAELAEALRRETARVLRGPLANERVAPPGDRARGRAASCASEHAREAAELPRREGIVEARRELEAAELKLADAAPRARRRRGEGRSPHERARRGRGPPRGGRRAGPDDAPPGAHARAGHRRGRGRRRHDGAHRAHGSDGATERRNAEESKRTIEESKRAAEESKRAAEESKRAIELLTAQRDAASARAEKLQALLDEERAERKDIVAAKAALEAEVIGLQRRIEELSTDQESEAAPEIVGLEDALRERGKHIASLERDLRESERIGRELISEIEAARAHLGRDDDGGGGFTSGGPGGSRPTPGGFRARWLGGSIHAAAGTVRAARGRVTAAAPSAPGAVDAVTADAFQHHIDALAADAAQKQAELLTSTWKIQALEREVEAARAAAADPPRIQQELSARSSARRPRSPELRRALVVTGREGTGVPRAVVEDSVLLHQQLAR